MPTSSAVIRQRRVAKGLCSECGRGPLKSKTMCQTCLDRIRVRKGSKARKTPNGMGCLIRIGNRIRAQLRFKGTMLARSLHTMEEGEEWLRHAREGVNLTRQEVLAMLIEKRRQEVNPADAAQPTSGKYRRLTREETRDIFAGSGDGNHLICL